MQTPDLFLDNPTLKRRIILYLSIHGFEFQDLFYDVRITCPDKNSTYHYCSRSKTLIHLYNSKKQKILNERPSKVTGFLEAICHYILPHHKAYLIYHVCKIPYLFKDLAEYNKEKNKN